MIRGPLEYVPPVEVDVVTKRKAIPLDENEGIYVRHIKSGKVSVYYCSIDLKLIFFLWLGSCRVWSNVHADSGRGVVGEGAPPSCGAASL